MSVHHINLFYKTHTHNFIHSCQVRRIERKNIRRRRWGPESFLPSILKHGSNLGSSRRKERTLILFVTMALASTWRMLGDYLSLSSVCIRFLISMALASALPRCYALSAGTVERFGRKVQLNRGPHSTLHYCPRGIYEPD